MLTTDIVKGYLRRFPDAKTRTLAHLIYKEHPKVWRNEDFCRSAIRYHRGQSGERLRGKLADKKFMKELKTGHESPFDKLPAGLVHFEDWKAVPIQGPMKALILPDIHFPYHDKPALVLALEHGERVGADTIILNGDTADFFSVSFWEKDPDKRDFQGELDAVLGLFSVLRDAFPAARIIFKEGNHEERWDRYMRVKAPECYSVEKFKAKAILELERFKMAYVSEKRPLKLGDLYLLHGHEYNFAISNPVNPARGLYLRAKTLAMCSHFHQTSQHSEKNLAGKVISTWSTGCLCDLHPDYRPLNPWNHGFAFVEVDAAGAFQVQNYRIIDGKIYA